MLGPAMTARLMETARVLSRWPIRNKLVFFIGLLVLIVATLTFSAVKGVYAYRGLAKSVSHRAAELPLATALGQHVSDARVTLSRMRSLAELLPNVESPLIETAFLREEFCGHLFKIRESLRRYGEQLDSNFTSDLRIGDDTREQDLVDRIEVILAEAEAISVDPSWLLDVEKVDSQRAKLDDLQQKVSDLPSFLQQRMHSFAFEIRDQYRTLIVVAWGATVLVVGLLVTLVFSAFRWVFRPLRVLVKGSRRVAGGDFDHRIELKTNDELGELASAMNGMTQRFQAIHADLDQQVKDRTQQVVRSEQLASVGFLAAGVAHEINNPLTSIAFCAESLESRLHDIIQEDDERPDNEHNDEISVLRSYLRMIQDQAFRCKQITERLLDYSRMGDSERHSTDLGELIEGVIEMIRTLGKYRNKQVTFENLEPAIAPVDPQEIKQVMLNLITNGLEAMESSGTVSVRLLARDGQARIEVADNGCGMTEEVRKHLFEPFFTRRLDGTGTGLGLSITYRIIQEHGGQIAADSAGPGRGSQFVVTLPLVNHESRLEKRPVAA